MRLHRTVKSQLTMAVLIVVTTNKQSYENMQHAHTKYARDLFLGKAARNAFLMKNNGLALMCAWKEKRRNPFYVDVYLAEELHDWQIPEKVRRAADWKVEKKYGQYPTSEKTLKEEGLPSREELEKIELDSSLK